MQNNKIKNAWQTTNAATAIVEVNKTFNTAKTALIITKIVIGNVFHPASRNRRNASAVNGINIASKKIARTTKNTIPLAPPA